LQEKGSQAEAWEPAKMSGNDSAVARPWLATEPLLFVHVGKGLPTYCVTRAVGRQPLAANDKQDIENAVTPLIRPKVYDQ